MAHSVINGGFRAEDGSRRGGCVISRLMKLNLLLTGKPFCNPEMSVLLCAEPPNTDRRLLTSLQTGSLLFLQLQSCCEEQSVFHCNMILLEMDLQLLNMCWFQLGGVLVTLINLSLVPAASFHLSGHHIVTVNPDFWLFL